MTIFAQSIPQCPSISSLTTRILTQSAKTSRGPFIACIQLTEEKLNRVLKMFVSAFPEFGYLQGMHNVAGVLISQLEEVDAAFLGMCSLRMKYKLHNIWDLNILVKKVVPLIKTKSRIKCPRVFEKMESFGEHVIVAFAARLIIPLYTDCVYSNKDKLILIDLFLIGGKHVLINAMVGIFLLNRKELCEESITEIDFLRTVIDYKMEVGALHLAEVCNIFEDCIHCHMSQRMRQRTPTRRRYGLKY